MSGLHPLKRKVTVFLMAVSFALLLANLRADATPIKPDIRKILSAPKQSHIDYVPARAGWNGPETPVRIDPLASTYNQLGPAATAREVHNALYASFVPDYRALAGVFLVIMLLRRIVHQRRKASATAIISSAHVPANIPSKHQRAA